jgi:hypothetical protein
MADEFQRLAFLKVKVLGFSFLLDWFCFERRDSRCNVLGTQTRVQRRFRFERWQFVLHLLSVFGANLDEGVNRADCYFEGYTLVKNADDVAVGAALPPKLADEFAVSFEFGAR